MSQIGYYRYKFTEAVEGIQQIVFYKNGNIAKVCSVIGKTFCANFRLLKYLDTDGQYRVFPFNANWEVKDKPTLIGKVNHFVTSILDSQSNYRNIGYTNERKITLTAGNVSQLELDKLISIYASPRVYLLIGETDAAKDWLLVSVTGDGIGRMKKNNFKKVTIEVTLPQQYAITKI